MKLLKRIALVIYTFYAISLFLAIMLAIFPFVLFSSWFGRIKGGNMIYKLCTLWADIWFPCIGIFHRNIFLEPLQKDRAYIFVINHTSYLDSALLVKVFRKPVRPLGKVEMTKIPIFGFIYKYAIVSVDRSSAINRARSLEELKRLIAKGISVLVFPEGTFNDTSLPLKSLYDGAFRLAIETQTPIRPVLFLDNFDRMNPRGSLGITPGKCRTVFLRTVEVNEQRKIDTLKAEVQQRMENALIEYKASWISFEKK